MNRRKRKDRRKVNYRVITDATERRKILDRRTVGMNVYEIKVSEEAFAEIFADFVIKHEQNRYKSENTMTLWNCWV